MTATFTRLLKRLHSHKGQSLAETLLVILILLLVSGVLTATVNLANKQYVNSRSHSEANVLASTLNAVLTNELGFATSVTIEGEYVKSFVGKSYITIENESILASVNGRIVIMDESDNTNYIEVLNRSSYPNGISAEIKSFKFFPDKDCFSLNLEIYDRNNELLLSKDFDILMANVLKSRDGNTYGY